jgi:hypothetical protein
MKFKTHFAYLLVAISLLSLAGCQPESETELGTKATASFTMTPVAGRVNTYLLTSTSQNAFAYQWFKGTGSFAKGKQVDTAYFPLRGTYTVRLRAFGRGGYSEAEQNVTIAVDDILSNPTFQLLTSKSWKLNPADGSIIVGTEGNPAQYFAGGVIANCQKDDVYTFSTAFKLNYNAAGSTFNGGNLAPNFTCDIDRSYSNVTYTFTPGTSAGAGIATITLPGAVPTNFIGVTDIASNNYRIISISATAMVLRSGTATETVHQFKFIPQ